MPVFILLSFIQEKGNIVVSFLSCLILYSQSNKTQCARSKGIVHSFSHSFLSLCQRTAISIIITIVAISSKDYLIHFFR